MRILEIIEPRTVQSRLGDLEQQRIQNRNPDKPETGADATGWPSDDPHIWIKQSTRPRQLNDLKNDPTYRWIQIIRPHIPHNPYLPRTYITDLKTDAQGKIWPQYHTETLIHGTNYAEKAISATQPDAVSEQAIQAMADKMWGNPDWIKVTPYAMTPPSMPDAQKIWKKCCALVRYITDNHTIPRSNSVRLKPDPQLMQAIRLIQQTVNENSNWITDLHANNFMIRLTAQGPQMVINDPVTTNSDSGGTI